MPLVSSHRTPTCHGTLSADVSALESEIDRLVHTLYHLTPEEVAIVEEGMKFRPTNATLNIRKPLGE